MTPAPLTSAELLSLPSRERRARLQAHVEQHVAELLKTTRRLDPRRPMKELGLDSLNAVQLRNRLEAIAGCKLPTTLVFNHPTIDAVTTALLARIESAEAVEEPAPVSETGSGVIARVRGMSAEEARAFLLELQAGGRARDVG